MSDLKNTITLNGKLYDAKSGLLLDSKKTQLINSIDGFKTTTRSSNQLPTTPKPVNHKPAHKISPSRTHHKPQHAKTLMRTAVKKPSKKPIASNSQLAIKRPVVSTERLQRARLVPKSKLISKFQAGNPKTNVNRSPHYEKQATHTPQAQAAMSPVSQAVQSTEDFLTAALSRATSHEQTLPTMPTIKRKKFGLSSRTLNVGAALLVVVILSAFITYQNLPNLSLRLAAQKAGIAASLPSFEPAGFSLSRSVEAQPGQVMLSFHSNSDARNFKITQTASNWNSQTLADNFFATSGQTYQRINGANGQTVFLYGSANATWVNGGIWYRLEGNSSLTSSQLLKVANSF